MEDLICYAIGTTRKWYNYVNIVQLRNMDHQENKMECRYYQLLIGTSSSTINTGGISQSFEDYYWEEQLAY